MPDKRLSEHCNCHPLYFPPNVKRPRAGAIRQFPKHFAHSCTQIDLREGHITSAQSEEPPTARPIPGEACFDEQKIKPKNLSQSQREILTKTSSKVLAANHVQPEPVIDMVSLKASSSQPPFSCKTSKIREGIFLSQQFPPKCGRQNFASFSEAIVLSDGSRGMKLNIGQKNVAGSTFGHTANSDNESQYITRRNKWKLNQKEKFTECIEEDEVQVLSSLEWNSYLCKFKNVTQKDNDHGCEDNKDNFVELGNHGCEDNKDNFVELGNHGCADNKDIFMEMGKSTVCIEQEEDEVQLLSSVECNSFLCNIKTVTGKDFVHGREDQEFNFKDLKKYQITYVSEDNKPNILAGSLTLDALPLPGVPNNIENTHLLKSEEPGDLHVATYEECQAVDHCNKVKKALKLFDELYAELLQKHNADSKRQCKAKCFIAVEVAQMLKGQKIWVNKGKVLGHIPGVKIGDSFRFRAELAVIGLHHQYIKGIDYVKIGNECYATSVVDSGRYKNEARSSDILIYFGEGGNPKTTAKKLEDQKLEGANLALVNSYKRKWPVRVVYCSDNAKGSKDLRARRYTYDGLYTVVGWVQEREQYGKLVFKFELHRNSDQPKLEYGSALNVKGLPEYGNIDISLGKEKMPICAVNEISNENPPYFTYTSTMIYPDWYKPAEPSGCDCINGCSDSKLCSCVAKNGGEIPFNEHGAIVRAKPIIYECGPSCKCPPSCMNRVSQHGPLYRLEVFRTESRGWGLRSHDYISPGSFICEYAGELLDDKEAEKRINHDEYLFDIGKNLGELDSSFYSRNSKKGNNRLTCVEVEAQSTYLEASNSDGFTVDAEKLGNVGRFINHSCSPNLFAQDVLYDHDDRRVPHVMFFAAKAIRPLKELTYDYNYKMDHVCDANGNIKRKDCYCGSRRCVGRMY